MEVFSYTIPYLILIVTLSFLAILEYKFRDIVLIKRWIQLYCFLVLLFFFGLRGFIGWDWYNYYILFKKVPTITDGGLLNFYSSSLNEPGFVTYVSIVKSIWPNYHFFIFVSTFIDLIIVSIFINRYSRFFVFSFILFIILGGFYLETDLLRNAKSIILFLISIKYIQDRKAFQFFGLNILGITFHVSSIMYLPMYFVLKRKFSRVFVISLFIIGNVIFLFHLEYIKPIILFFSHLLGGKFEYLASFYFNSSYTKPYGLTIGYFERLIMGFLVILFYKKLIINSQNLIFVNAYLIYFVLFFYFSEVGVIGLRLGNLFVFSYWILIPLIIETFNFVTNKLFYLFYLYLYIIIKTFGMTNTILYKYDNILWGIESYEERKIKFNNFKP
jgi:hypothetical protein